MASVGTMVNGGGGRRKSQDLTFVVRCIQKRNLFRRTVSIHLSATFVY